MTPCWCANSSAAAMSRASRRISSSGSGPSRAIRAPRLSAQRSIEVDVLARLRDGANADDVRVLELCRRLALVAKPALELGIARVAGLEDLDRDRSPIGRPADERPSKAPLAQEPLQGIGAKRLADEVGSGLTHFTKGCKSVNLRRFQRLGNRDDVR